MAADTQLPAGYTLDSAPPPDSNSGLPAGYTLDKQDSSTFTGALKEYWNKINPVTAVKGLAHAVAHPIDTAVAGGQADEAVLDSAMQAFKDGRYKEGVMHGLAYLTPGLSPQLDEIGNKARSGDYGGAAADTAALATNLAAPALAEGGVNLLARGVRAAATPATEALGVTTGAGGKALRTAIDNPTPEFVSAMRGGLSEADVLNDFKSSVQDLRDARGAQYQARLSQLPKGQTVDIAPLKSQMDTQLQKFNIGKNADGSLDFSRSTISDPSAQAAVKGTYEDVTSWGSKTGDQAPLGVDTLVRRIGDRYTPNGQARAFVQAMKDTGSQTLSQQVPGYAGMKAGYAQASDFLDKLKDLSLEGNPGTATRKLSTLLQNNNGYRQVLVDQLSQFADKDLTGEAAGLKLNSMLPKGGAVAFDTGIGILGGVFHGMINPYAAVSMAAASPRLMGELLMGMSKARPYIQAAAPVAGAAVGAGNVIRQNTTAGQAAAPGSQTAAFQGMP